MARTNFKFQKRQKELAKQAKAEEKRLRKLEKRNPTDDGETLEPQDDVESAQPDAGEEASDKAGDDAA